MPKMTAQEALAVIQREHDHGTGSIPKGAFGKALAVLRECVKALDEILYAVHEHDRIVRKEPK